MRRQVLAAVLAATMTASGCATDSDGGAAGRSPSSLTRDEPPAAETPELVPPLSVRKLQAGGATWSMTVTRGAAWVQVDPPVDAISRVPLDGGRARPVVRGGHQVRKGAEGLWVVGEDWLARVDPGTGGPVERIPIGGDFALGQGAVWVYDHAGLRRVDARTGRVSAVMGTDATGLCQEPAGLLIAFGSAWVACEEGSVVRIPLDEGRSERIETAPGSHTLAATADAVWVTNYDDDSFSRIDPSTSRVRTTPGAGVGAGITVGGGSVWISAYGGIAKVDPESARITEIVDLGIGYGSNLYELAWHDGAIVASTRSSELLVVEPA